MDLYFEVTNYSGQLVSRQLVSSKEIIDNNLKLPLTGLQSGIYFIKIVNEKEVINVKLIIAK